MKLIPGKTYLVTTQRKGTFFLRVTDQSDTWTCGVIAAGRTQALLDYNKREAGEEVTCRTRLILSATMQPDAQRR